MQVDLSILYAASKTVSASAKWKFRDSEWMQLIAPLDIDGVTVEGLSFRATAMRKRPDEAVSFQLEYSAQSPNSKSLPFARVEWKPLRPHRNKKIGPVELHNIPQAGSHNHDFWLNWRHSEKAVRKGLLDISIPILPEMSFEEIVAFVGKEFRILNINLLPKPEWSGMLF